MASSQDVVPHHACQRRLVANCKLEDYIEGFLASNAKTYAGDRIASGLRYGRIAFRTLSQALAARHFPTSAFYRVLDAGVDLILNGPVASPANGHDLPRSFGRYLPG